MRKLNKKIDVVILSMVVVVAMMLLVECYAYMFLGSLLWVDF